MRVFELSTFRSIIGAVTVSVLAMVGSVQAQDKAADSCPDRKIELGTLECTVQPETRRNYIVRSTAQVECIFDPVEGDGEWYRGETGIKLGLDFSVREKDKFRFLVVSSHEVGEARPPHALAGKYFGPSIAACVTYGVGVSALLGGTRGEISLQPIGIETLQGLGISAGMGYLYLEPGKIS